MTRYFSSVFIMLPFVGLIINLIILFRGDLKIVSFITGLCLSVVHGRSEHLEARMGVCFLDTWVPGSEMVA